MTTQEANNDWVWLLYADETNVDPHQAEFFVYGGMAVASGSLPAFHRDVAYIREAAKVPADCLVKFNPGPEGMDHRSFIALKQAYLEAAAKNGIRMLVDVVHHNIIRDGDVNEARRMAINRLCLNFHYLIESRDAHGLVLIDRFSDPKIDAHLREKASVGLLGMPYSDSLKLERILGIHYSAIGQAHACSLVDIAIGSLRFAINAHTKGDSGRLETSKTLLGLLSPLFDRGEFSGKIEQTRFHLSPQTVKVEGYRKRYQDLKDFLASGGLELSQEVTDTRTY
jgi:hypothetical protein